MALHFPNPSRSYDADGRRIRFWGHDDALEVPFFLEESALFKLYPKTTNAEPEILAAFDAARTRILAVAGRVYTPRRRKSFYVLTPDDF
jgi:hypothetical protein